MWSAIVYFSQARPIVRVMPGLVPGIHAFLHHTSKTWMAGTSPAMTAVYADPAARKYENSGLIPAADRDLADAKAGQLPDASAARVLVGVDVDVDQVRLVGGDRHAHRVADVAGAVDPHTFDAGRARHRGEIRLVGLAGLR